MFVLFVGNMVSFLPLSLSLSLISFHYKLPKEEGEGEKTIGRIKIFIFFVVWWQKTKYFDQQPVWNVC